METNSTEIIYPKVKTNTISIHRVSTSLKLSPSTLTTDLDFSVTFNPLPTTMIQTDIEAERSMIYNLC